MQWWRMSLTGYRTKRDVTADLLREAILDGELAPGTRLLLEELSARYHVSLTPIREALSQLEREGFVSQTPHRGAVVAALDREELLELYAIRSAIEELATLHGVPRLTDRDLATMSQLLDALEAFEGSWDAFLDIDMQFHRILYRAAGSQRWLDTIEALWRRSRRYMLSSTSASGAVATLHSDHRAIYRACCTKDAPAAAVAIHAHLKQSEERLLRDWA
jgi:DNA-binding GntR family transcriptional regulator